MEIDAVNLSPHLVETNIVKSLEARARDGAHPMVRHEEVLLPAHKDVLVLGNVLVVAEGAGVQNRQQTTTATPRLL